MLETPNNDNAWLAALAQAADLPWKGEAAAKVEAVSITDGLDIPPELENVANELQQAVNRGETTAGAARASLVKLVEVKRTEEAKANDIESARDARRAALDNLHRNLYATDATYRAETDAITTEADQRIEKSDQRQREADDLAAEHGITTPHDAAVTDARAKYEEARKNGDMVAARAAEVELHQLQEEQAKERERQLRAMGLDADADRMGEIGVAAHDDFAAAMGDYDKQANALREALRRKVAMGLMSPEELAKWEETLTQEREQLLHDGSVEKATKMQGVREDQLTELNQPPTQALRLEVAEAYIADDRSPTASPNVAQPGKVQAVQDF